MTADPNVAKMDPSGMQSLSEISIMHFSYIINVIYMVSNRLPNSKMIFNNRYKFEISKSNLFLIVLFKINPPFAIV